jgi:hypothetical protein
MQVTFLSAGNGLRLSKTFTPSGTNAYPLVKAMTSSDFTVSDLQELYPLIKSKAASGECLLKGNLKRPITEESRAGKTDRAKYNQLLILDIDGIELPSWFFTSQLTSQDIEKAAAQVISELPQYLHNVSYIAHASSSFGVKQSAVSLHLFFMLSIPMPPATIKLWTKGLNFSSSTLINNLSLSVNGQSLKYPIDLSVADNSHICFIAPPLFDNVANPFAHDDDRFALVNKELETFDLAGNIGNVNPQLIFDQEHEIKNRLREEAGNSKKQAKTKQLAINNRHEEVLLNPDRMQITVSDTTSLPFVRCNINGGDSNAYYFDLNDPRWMSNFKGEPFFEIEKADPDFFATIRELFSEELSEGKKPSRPVTFRDFDTDTFYCGIFDQDQNQFSSDYPLRPIQKQNIEGFLLNHAAVMPDILPEGKQIFNPTINANVTDINARPLFVNTFRQSELMGNAMTLNEPYTLGDTPKIQAACPTVYKLLLHILGDGHEELERFINWLAYIFQTRNKSMAGWCLGGTQGTGKQIFYTFILKPLFGDQHVQVRKLQDIEENFNAYMRDALFLIVDEFHMASANSSALKMAEKLKHEITEPNLTIRAMRTDQISQPSFTNFLFLTNRHDAITMEQDDRRYTIAPRQEQSLIEKYPDFLDNLDLIKQELPTFANILKSWQYSKRLAETSMNNEAKGLMRQNSMSVVEEFINAVKQGDLYYFLPILDIETNNIMNPSSINAAKKYVKSWIADSTIQTTTVNTATLNLIYSTLTEEKISIVKFGKTLSRFGLTQTQKRVQGENQRGHTVEWALNPIDRQRLINDNFSDSEKNAYAKA